MKKLLYLPLNVPNGASEQKDLEKAFRRVYDTKVLSHYEYEKDDFSKILTEVVEGWRPDYVHIQYSDRIDLTVIAILKNQNPRIIWTHWTGDCRSHLIKSVINCGKVCDATLLASGIGQREVYERKIGTPVFYWQHAVADWQFKELLPEETKTEIVMAGNVYGREVGATLRLDLAKALSKEFPTSFTVYGDGYSGIPDKNKGGRTRWEDQTDIYNKAAVTLGPSIYNDIEGYWSDRPLIAMAAGTCHLWQETPNLPFTAPTYGTVTGAVKKIKFLLDNPEERHYYAKRQQLEVKEGHTWDERVKEYQTFISAITLGKSK